MAKYYEIRDPQGKKRGEELRIESAIATAKKAGSGSIVYLVERTMTIRTKVQVYPETK